MRADYFVADEWAALKFSLQCFITMWQMKGEKWGREDGKMTNAGSQLGRIPKISFRRHFICLSLYFPFVMNEIPFPRFLKITKIMQIHSVVFKSPLVKNYFSNVIVVFFPVTNYIQAV